MLRIESQIIRIGGMPELPKKVPNFLLDQINLILKAAMNSCSLGPHSNFLGLQALSGSLQPEMEVVMFSGKLGFQGRAKCLLSLCQRCSPKTQETPDVLH